jgi:hypothetical protein
VGEGRRGGKGRDEKGGEGRRRPEKAREKASEGHRREEKLLSHLHSDMIHDSNRALSSLLPPSLAFSYTFPYPLSPLTFSNTFSPLPKHFRSNKASSKLSAADQSS